MASFIKGVSARHLPAGYPGFPARYRENIRGYEARSYRKWVFTGCLAMIAFIVTVLFGGWRGWSSGLILVEFIVACVGFGTGVSPWQSLSIYERCILVIQSGTDWRFVPIDSIVRIERVVSVPFTPNGPPRTQTWQIWNPGTKRGGLRLRLVGGDFVEFPTRNPERVERLLQSLHTKGQTPGDVTRWPWTPRGQPPLRETIKSAKLFRWQK